MKHMRAYIVFCIYSAMMELLRSMHFTATAIYYVTVVGLNPFQLVFVGTTLMIVILLAEVPTGVVADTYSRRLSVIIGTALIGLGFLVEGAIAQFAAVLVAQVIWGVGFTFTSGALQAWIADEVGGENLDAIFLRGSQIGNAGALVGIASGVVLASFHLSLALVVSGALGLALAIFLALFMSEHGFTPQPRKNHSPLLAAQQTLGAGARLVRGRPMLWIILGITFCFGMASESFDRLWEVHFLSQAGFPSLEKVTPVAWLGMINAGALLISIGVAEWARHRLNMDTQHRLVRVLAIITALVIVGMVGFGLATTFTVALIAYWAAYLMRRLYEPLYTAWLSQNSEPEVRATIFSMFGQVDALGQIAGGPLFGLIATIASTGTAIIAAACLLVPALLLYRLALRRGQAARIEETSALAAIDS